MTQTQLSMATGFCNATIGRYVERLAFAGRVTRTRIGSAILVSLADVEVPNEPHVEVPRP